MSTVDLLLRCASILSLTAGVLSLTVITSTQRTRSAARTPARTAAGRAELSLPPSRAEAVRRLVRRGGRPDRASEQVFAVAVAVHLQRQRRCVVPLVLVAAGLAALALVLRPVLVLAAVPALGATLLVLHALAVGRAARRSRPLLAPYLAAPRPRERAPGTPSGASGRS